VDTKPQLEIWADDVQCSHGATVGQLDLDQLFYLRARGIDKQTAKSMLLNAFASDVLSNIKIEAFRTLIEGKINERL
jgi:Fe-S cluster assembly protein SufD